MSTKFAWIAFNSVATVDALPDASVIAPTKVFRVSNASLTASKLA